MSDNKPLESFSVGGFSVALWENEVEVGNETKRSYKTVTLRKSFYDKKKRDYDSQTVSINPSEIGCIVTLLQKMEEAVVQNGERTPF